MTDEVSAAMFATAADWLASHRRSYLETQGAAGHVMDLTFSGGRRFSTHLLLHHIGRKSAKRYISPLFYGATGGEVIIVASKGGADHNPSWYENLIAREEVRFQIASQAFRGTWRLPEGGERQRLWDFMVHNNNSFANYQSMTTRQIPLVALQAGDDIPAFTAADADA